MKDFQNDHFNTADDTGDGARVAGAVEVLMETRLPARQERLREMDRAEDPVQCPDLDLEQGRLLVGLNRGDEAWQTVRTAIDVYFAAELWERAAADFEVLFLADQEHLLSALGQGVWLAVTLPIDPEATLAMLQHIFDETSEQSVCCAVAAASAVYVIDLRAEQKQHNDLHFPGMRTLGEVARRHGGVKTQSKFTDWVEDLGLNDPAKPLPRMRDMIDALVQDDRWFDSQKIRAQLPLN